MKNGTHLIPALVVPYILHACTRTTPTVLMYTYPFIIDIYLGAVPVLFFVYATQSRFSDPESIWIDPGRSKNYLGNKWF